MSRFAIRKLEGGSVTPINKVIKSAEQEMLVESHKLIETIKAQAQELYKQRKADAIAAGNKEVVRLNHEQIIESMTITVRYLSQIEKRFVDVVVDAVKKIIGGMDTDDKTIRMIKKVLYEFRNEHRITLKVADSQLAKVREQVKKIMEPYPNIEFIDVIADHSMEKGNCRLEGESGSIMTSIEEQLRVLEEAMRKDFAVGAILQRGDDETA